MTNEAVLERAKKWKFICQQNSAAPWEILPREKNYNWQLRQQGEEWLLLVEGRPQVCLSPEEAIAFLKWRWLTENNNAFLVGKTLAFSS